MKIKHFAFGSLTLFISFIICTVLILAIDINRWERGVNYRGYRGKIVGGKGENEIRLVVLGGSVAYGYDIPYCEAMPAKLEDELQLRCNSLGFNYKITVINLAYKSEGCYAFYYNLTDFLYLDYDFAIFYSGYNDLGIGNTYMYRHSNPIFRLFGYMPILPELVHLKLVLSKSSGQTGTNLKDERIIFKPNINERIKIAALDKMLKMYNRLDNILDRLKKSKVQFDLTRVLEDEWAWYKHFMKKAINFTLEHDKKIIVITQPYLGDIHRQQQASLRKMLFEEYRNNKNLLYINLGESISLKDETLSFDALHLTPKGCHKMAAIIAERIAGYVYENNK